MFMDVSVPVPLMTHGNDNMTDTIIDPDLEMPSTVLSVALFHADKTYHNSLSLDTTATTTNDRYPSKKKTSHHDNQDGDSNEPFLGMCTLDVRPLLTGKTVTIDRWLPLTTGMDQSRGKVRIVCEYEASDPPPRKGDWVRFTRFCNPEDLYPVPTTRTFRVTEVDGDDVMLSYQTDAEGWWCTFLAHRLALICQERHRGALNVCEEELASVTERLSHSPMLQTVVATVDRVPNEGLLTVSVDAALHGASLLGRWWNGGLDTAVNDLSYATNWDGRFNQSVLGETPSIDDSDDESSNNDSPSTVPAAAAARAVMSPPHSPVAARAALPGMPSCPITGEPMVEPVVAADGHTYERAAIARWLRESDKSPLTGSILPHKELVPNYVLLSSLERTLSLASGGPVKTSPGKSNDDDQKVAADTTIVRGANGAESSRD